MPGMLFAGCGSWKPSSRPSQGPPVPGMENPKRLILLGGGLLSTSLGPEFRPLRELRQDFQSKALKIYVSHRLAGMGEGATLAITAKTMRETDMFDQ